MLHRKELKRRAKHNLKKHYLLFVALCLIAAFIGSEFSSSLSIINSAPRKAPGPTRKTQRLMDRKKDWQTSFYILFPGIWKKAMLRLPGSPSTWSPSLKKTTQQSSAEAGAYFPCSLTASLPALFSSGLPWVCNLCFSPRASL